VNDDPATYDFAYGPRNWFCLRNLTISDKSYQNEPSKKSATHLLINACELLTMKSILLLVFLITLSAANSVADDAKPTDGFVDKLTSGTNVTINTPENLSASFASGGMTLTVNNVPGSEWYWSNGGGSSYDNPNNLAFPLSPESKQNKLIIVVTSIAPGATLKVGAFLFTGTALVSGKNQLLGAENGGMNITEAGTYEFDVSEAAKRAGVTTADGWKADFWFTPEAAIGQAITFSSIAASTSTATPSSSSSSP